MTYFSFCIPTRDRPDLLRKTIQSILNQTYADFEIVISDNPIKSDCQDVIESFDDSRIKYSKAEKPLSLNDNWQRALSLSTGKYAGIFLDKILLQPYCLSKCLDVIKRYNTPDIISWPREVYYPQTEDPFGEGKLSRTLLPKKPKRFLPYDEWERRLSFKSLRDGKNDFFHRGKIVFGFYSRDLIQKIIRNHGHVFPAFFPDYTSLSYALAYAKSGVDLMSPMIMGIQPKESTGISLNTEQGFLQKFLETFTDAEELYNQLPYPEALFSQHNIAARDYLVSASNSEVTPPILNKENLKKCISYDICNAPLNEDISEELKKQLLDDELCLSKSKDALIPNDIENKPITFIKRVFKTSLKPIGRLKFISEILSWPNPNRNHNDIERYPNPESALAALGRFHKGIIRSYLHLSLRAILKFYKIM